MRARQSIGAIRGGAWGIILSDIMKGHGLSQEEWENGPGTLGYQRKLEQLEKSFIPPESRHDKSNIVNISSLDTETAQYLSDDSGSEPVILNNLGSTSSGQPLPMNHISNVGDSKVKEFYPRVF